MLKAPWWVKDQWGLLWSREEPGSQLPNLQPLLVRFNVSEAGADAAMVQGQTVGREGSFLAEEEGTSPTCAMALIGSAAVAFA